MEASSVNLKKVIGIFRALIRISPRLPCVWMESHISLVYLPSISYDHLDFATPYLVCVGILEIFDPYLESALRWIHGPKFFNVPNGLEG